MTGTRLFITRRRGGAEHLTRGRGGAELLYPASCILLLCLLVQTSYAMEPSEAVAGLRQRYKTVETVRGKFRQTYRAPGIVREESGEFWLKKPGLMRWEYRAPEEQLFVADGRESFLYVPADRQVTVQPLTAADLHNTPLEFLLGGGGIEKSFDASWEKELKPGMDDTALIRLTPRTPDSQYSFLVVEIDGRTFDLRRIVIREPVGSTSEFLFMEVATNVKVDNNLFRFKIPKGVEVNRMRRE